MNTRTLIKYLGFVAIMICFAVTTLGWTSDGFDPEGIVWRSSDIVVVDTEGIVEEAWFGSVKLGASIDIEKLGISARVVYSSGMTLEQVSEDKWKNVPRPEVEIEASRMILFLRMSDDGTWQGATLNEGEDTRYAVVWYIDGTLWSWNPSNMYPSQFSPLPRYTDFSATSFDQLKEYVTDVSDTRTALEEANKIPDKKTRAEHLERFVTEDCLTSFDEALDYLSSCGTEALPTFRLLLFDNARLQRQRYIMDSLVKACGHKAKPLLIDVIKDEIPYWQKKESTLKEEWGHGSSVTPENGHYNRLNHALYMLQEVGISHDDIPLLQTVAKTMAALPKKEVYKNKEYVDDDDRMRLLLDKLLELARESIGKDK